MCTADVINEYITYLKTQGHGQALAQLQFEIHIVCLASPIGFVR